MMDLRIVVGVALAVAAFAASPTSAQDETSVDLSAYGEITWHNTGDSYASGEGVRGNRGNCAQSPLAFGPRAVEALEGEANVRAAFTACTGHLVEDFFTPRPDAKEDQDSQYHWGAVEQGIGEQVDVITFSYGGNDIGFADLILDCLIVPEDWRDYADFAIDRNVGRLITSGLTGCDTSSEELTRRLENLLMPERRCEGGIGGGRVPHDPDPYGCDLIIGADGERGSIVDFYVHLARTHLTDRGRVFVLGYPSLFAPVDEWPGYVKFECQGIKRGDAERLIELSGDLDAALADAVRQANDRLGAEVYSYISRRVLFRDAQAELCGAGEDWLNGIAVNRGDYSYNHKLSFHPNAEGHEAPAAEIVRQIRRDGLRRVPPGQSGVLEQDAFARIAFGTEADVALEQLQRFPGPADRDSGWQTLTWYSWLVDGSEGAYSDDPDDPGASNIADFPEVRYLCWETGPVETCAVFSGDGDGQRWLSGWDQAVKTGAFVNEGETFTTEEGYWAGGPLDALVANRSAELLGGEAGRLLFRLGEMFGALEGTYPLGDGAVPLPGERIRCLEAGVQPNSGFAYSCGVTFPVGSDVPGLDAPLTEITANSWGPIQDGMSVAQIEALFGTALQPFDELDDGQCYVMEVPGYSFSEAYVQLSGRAGGPQSAVSEVFYVFTPEISTPSGARVGMSVEELLDLFPGRLQESRGMFTELPVFDFVLNDPGPSTIRFVTDGSVVTSMQSGSGYHYEEGCL